MQFSKIYGQDSIKQRLIHSFTDNRVSHAQLFLGHEGNGSLQLAIAYAQFIMCAERTENDSCGVCHSCAKIKNLVHPDLHFAFPYVLAEADNSNDVIAQFRECFIENPYMNLRFWTDFHSEENKQPIINVKEAQNILARLSLKSYEGGYKVMIIWMAEYMNVQTANKLLKILEEPPEQTLFILVAENQEGLLPTILSRTQIIKIPKVDTDSTATYLTNVLGVNEADMASILAICNGNLWEAEQLVKEAQDGDSNLGLFREWMLSCYKQNVIDCQDMVEKIAGLGREKQKNFLHYSLQIFRQCLMNNYTGDELVRLRGAEYEFMQKFSAFIGGQNIAEVFELFNNAHYYIERNGNPKLIFMNISLKMMRYLKMEYVPQEA